MHKHKVLIFLKSLTHGEKYSWPALVTLASPNGHHRHLILCTRLQVPQSDEVGISGDHI